MKNKINLSWLLLLFLFLTSCDDIFEEDISGESIIIVNPQNGDLIEGNSVQFLWNSLKGATEYNIQVYGDNQLAVDTSITAPPFIMVLNEGTYQWRVKGENFAYQTDYTFPVQFEVIQTEDLSNQTLILSSPSDNLYTNNTLITFTWETLPNATSYSFEVQKVTQSGNITILLEEEVNTNSITIDSTILDEDAHYIWKAKAVNETSATAFSSRNLFIDTVDPVTPTLLTPEFEEEFELNEQVNFSWIFGADPGNFPSPVTSYFELATDVNFNTTIENVFIESTNVSLEFETPGIYYWRVRGEDFAGNIGPFNQNGQFIVNE
tara:strand:+ start:29809 stop:30771 length:963 start_codon:yes stop_codon:yes gene_type:complete